MRFRPCIDIHNGQVKQIVGGSLSESDKTTKENYVSDKDAGYFASIYRENDLPGGHIIMLNKVGTDEYEASKKEALKGLMAYPGGMQIGGGITSDNALEFIEAGASHVIVTSYVFDDIKLSFNKLKALSDAVGRERIVLDLSCRYNNGRYYVVTDRWQKFTDVTVDEDTFKTLSDFCDEFLIHGVDVEGMRQGIDERLLDILAKASENVTITYAGGVRDLADIDIIRNRGRGMINFTVGSALDLFGGTLKIEEIIKHVATV